MIISIYLGVNKVQLSSEISPVLIDFVKYLNKLAFISITH
jgi:hypothetical protein